MKKHILFDVDGTLLDSKENVLYSLRDALQEYDGKRREIQELEFSLGIPGMDALARLGIPAQERDGLLLRWEKLTEKYQDRLRLFPGIRSEVERLKKEGVRLGIVTSRTRQEYREGMLPFGLGDFFDEVICMEDTERHKPDGEPVKEYLRRTGAKAEDVVYIGDTGYDMSCAHDAGVEGALALWGCISASHIQADYYLAQPDVIGETFLDTMEPLPEP